MSAELEQVERVLADVLTSADPWSELGRIRSDTALPETVRAQLAAIDQDGLRIAGLLVAKLRFERLMNGSRTAAEWFERDPAVFTDAFRRYHTTIAPRELMPGLEARRFEAWIESHGRCG